MRPPPRRPSGSGPLSWLLILAVLAMAVALPLLGAWVASTLVVHQEAPRELAVAAALGLALVLPLAWELYSLPRRRADGTRPKRWLRLRSRLLLRTWALNLAFLAGALLLSPRSVFTALSTRGDWMLPPTGGAAVETTRRILFAAADGVEWAYVLATDNPYRDQLIAVAPAPPPRPASVPLPEPAEIPEPPPPAPGEDPFEGDSDVIISWKTESPKPEPPSVSQEWPIRTEKRPEPRKRGQHGIYPLPAQLHPRVLSVPRWHETDLESVARYLVSGEPDPFQRIKALHDYVADRVAYDVEAYRTKNYPSQRPEAVFQARKAVCAGYANLFAAMGHAVGEEIVTVSGDAISLRADREFEGHAWNAVRIRDEWYLVDVTWNAGGVNGDVFTRYYLTSYLFMPPQEFIRSHFPDDPAWQLLERPLERGEALRLARTHSEVHSAVTINLQESSAERPQAEQRPWDGIRIREPAHARAEVRGRFHVELDNPRGLATQVSLVNTQDGSQEPCHPEYGGMRYACTALNRGLYRIQVHAGPRDATPQLMAQLEVMGM